MAAKFRNGGQTCVCPNRVFVHRSVFDAFAAKLAAKVAALKVGPASNPASQIGPMINDRAVEKIERHVQDAYRLKAPRCSPAGGAAHLGPNYYAPTVLSGADASNRLRRNLWPRAPLFVFDDGRGDCPGQRHAVWAGRVLYSQNVKRIWRVADAGKPASSASTKRAIAAEAAPFGGVKESGYGRGGSTRPGRLPAHQICLPGAGSTEAAPDNTQRSKSPHQRYAYRPEKPFTQETRP